MSVKLTKVLLDENGYEVLIPPLDDEIHYKVEDGKTYMAYTAALDDADWELLRPDNPNGLGVAMVNFHRDFYLDPKIVSKDDLAKWYGGHRIPQEKAYHIFPLTCFVHGSVYLILGCETPSWDPGGFDTSHVGAVLVPKALTQLRSEAEVLAENCVQDWNDYLNGDYVLYVVQVHDHKTGKDEIVESTIVHCSEAREMLKEFQGCAEAA